MAIPPNSNTPNFFDWTKAFGEYKTPAFDLSQVLAFYNSNAKTSAAVLQIAAEAANTLGSLGAKIVKANAEQMLQASKDLMNPTAADTRVSKQADFAKSQMEYNFKAGRELVETMTKSTQEAFDVINKRIAEQVREFSDAASKTTQTYAKKAA